MYHVESDRSKNTYIHIYIYTYIHIYIYIYILCIYVDLLPLWHGQ